jgi:hypothetical protein
MRVPGCSSGAVTAPVLTRVKCGSSVRESFLSSVLSSVLSSTASILCFTASPLQILYHLLLHVVKAAAEVGDLAVQNLDRGAILFCLSYRMFLLG